MNNKAVCNEIVETGRSLIQKGLVAGTWGNISARIADGRIAVTPSGRNYLTLTSEDIVQVDLVSGRTLSGGTPSSELAMHLAVYRHRPDVTAIVHTHSVFASACATARRAIPPIIEDLIQIAGGRIEVAEYALPGTEALATQAVAALGDRQAALLANHGVVTCGGSLKEAMLVAQLVEKAAQIFIYAHSLGGAVALSDDDVKIMREFYLAHYRLRQEGRE